jgi:UDP-N-acetylmuramate dehydrogenase
MTTFRIGGNARHFSRAGTEKTVMEALETAKEKQWPLFILGGGSNLLVADEGYPGLVLRIELSGVEWAIDGDGTIVRAAAGEDWDDVVQQCVERGLAGVECLSGIPGSVGGTPIQNVGAYGQEVSQVLTSVRVLDRVSESIVELPASACGFTYRSSIFNTTERDRYIVLAVTYRLPGNGIATTHYSDVRRALEGRIERPSVADVRRVVREIRASKAMLLTTGDPDCRSAGSFFRNPIIPETTFADIQRAAGDAAVPKYPAREGYVKTAAAWLIEQSGFAKGYTAGKAGLSAKHTLALVNKGSATARDVLNLAREIRARVKDRFGVQLVPEPVFLGFEPAVYEEFFGRGDSEGCP